MTVRIKILNKTEKILITLQFEILVDAIIRNIMMQEQLLPQLTLIRKRLIYIIVGYIVSSIITFYYKDFFYHILAIPILNISDNKQLIAIDVLSSVLIPIKTILYIAFFLQLPHMLLQIWYFISHGLSQKENKIFIIISIFSLLMMFISLLFCVKVLIPNFCQTVNQYQIFPITILPDIEKYYNFIFSLIIAIAICCQLPVLILILTLCNLINLKQLKLFRKYAVIISFVTAAIITPPDLISQFIVAIPLYLLYELSLLITKIFK